MNFLRGFLLNQEMFEGFEKFRNVLCSVFRVPCFVLWVKRLLKSLKSLKVWKVPVYSVFFLTG